MIYIFYLLILYVFSIQYERGGIWLLCGIFIGPALILDFLVNTIFFTVYFIDLPFKQSEFLNRTEWTLSDRLERLVLVDNPRKHLARPIAKLLNTIAPSGNHIKNFKEKYKWHI